MEKVKNINSFTPEIGYHKTNEIINKLNELIDVIDAVEAKNGKEKADTGTATGKGTGKGK